MNNGFSKVRVDDIVVQEIGSELLLFDKRSDSAHSLSPAASIVWQACDGRTAPEAVVAKLAALGIEDPQRVFDEALSDFDAKGLLADGVSRRAAIKKMGAVAFATPLVVSIVAPMAAHATSGGILPLNSPCTANNQCSGNLICATATSGVVRFCSDTTPCVPTGANTTVTGGSRCNLGSGTQNPGQCCSNTCNSVVGVCG